MRQSPALVGARTLCMRTDRGPLGAGQCGPRKGMPRSHACLQPTHLSRTLVGRPSSIILGSIASCRRSRTGAVRSTHFTNFASGSAHAQPANPRTSRACLSFLALAAHARTGIRAPRRQSDPPAKPPCRFNDRQGSWFETTWRDGGVDPSTPSSSTSRTERGRSTTLSVNGR